MNLDYVPILKSLTFQERHDFLHKTQNLNNDYMEFYSELLDILRKTKLLNESESSEFFIKGH